MGRVWARLVHLFPEDLSMKIDSERLKRRSWLGSVATLGAAVAGSMALAPRNPVADLAVKADATAAESGPNAGYQLTEHVKRYYATARV
jgi:hypothetical protein